MSLQVETERKCYAGQMLKRLICFKSTIHSSPQFLCLIELDLYFNKLILLVNLSLENVDQILSSNISHF